MLAHSPFLVIDFMTLIGLYFAVILEPFWNHKGTPLNNPPTLVAALGQPCYFWLPGSTQTPSRQPLGPILAPDTLPKPFQNQPYSPRPTAQPSNDGLVGIA